MQRIITQSYLLTSYCNRVNYFTHRSQPNLNNSHQLRPVQTSYIDHQFTSGPHKWTRDLCGVLATLLQSQQYGWTCRSGLPHTPPGARESAARHPPQTGPSGHPPPPPCDLKSQGEREASIPVVLLLHPVPAAEADPLLPQLS